MQSDKNFLTYNQQMRKLRDSKNIICKGTADKTVLCRYGYFNLVNGYKKPFVASKDDNGHIYINGTDMSSFLSLKHFDEDLRMTLLKYIVRAEEEIRTFVGYKFDQVNNEGEIPWFNVAAYDPNAATTNVVALISEAYSEINRSEQDYVTFYMKNHRFIPTWILIKTIDFSTFIKFILYSNIKVRRSICELYSIKNRDGFYDFKLLEGSLHWLRLVRNSCAHNERIYCMKRPNSRLDNIYLDLMPKSYKRDRDQKIIDLLFYLKFYLSSEDYAQLIETIKSLLMKLKNDIHPQAFDYVRSALGIKYVLHLDKLLEEPKRINYNKFDTFEK